ncbi:hypothetical protein VMCG_03302 [Cytospora schulzeri]|uniref:Uncharacterized protein n=1 Tax=Cytospora schulzeri TaxID=448051 RepID=A0A423WXI5_9PEZI|nr:hypothetical protein VMCG_03302 [Valsa malicola]
MEESTGEESSPQFGSVRTPNDDDPIVAQAELRSCYSDGGNLPPYPPALSYFEKYMPTEAKAAEFEEMIDKKNQFMDRIELDAANVGFKLAYDYTRKTDPDVVEDPGEGATPPSSYLHSSKSGSASASGSGSGRSGGRAESSKRAGKAVAGRNPTREIVFEDVPEVPSREARNMHRLHPEKDHLHVDMDILTRSKEHPNCRKENSNCRKGHLNNSKGHLNCIEESLTRSMEHSYCGEDVRLSRGKDHLHVDHVAGRTQDAALSCEGICCTE